MYYDAAPLEGVTDYIYRHVHSRIFPGVDRYYTPFLAANRTYALKKREKKEVAPELNSGVILMPQILTDDPDVLVWAVSKMRRMGYRTVNLNLGCPSASVTRHGKGAGFLADPDRLDAFFETYFEKVRKSDASDVTLTVKTRTGMYSHSESGRLIGIYNRYPIREVIVHPRTGKMLYGGEADLDAFAEYAGNCVHPLIYNGDIFDGPSLERITALFPDICGVMLGRGLIANPALIRMLKGGGPADSKELRLFHDELLLARIREGGYEINAGKMKEMWYYMGHMFPGAADELASIWRAQTLDDYRRAVDSLFKRRKHDPFSKFSATI